MKLKLLFLSAAMTLASGNASAVFFHIGSGSIDGSLCVGNDCLESEAFGFDTIRLKENNLRIHFEDTSTTTGFPTTDWRILINDTASGGDSFFGIQDSSAGTRPFTISAGARTHALFVDSQGDVGIGTSTPVVELHAVRGDTPTLRLEQDGSSGFTPQTWDIAGNEAGFFIRDATGGSTLPFRIITGGAPSNSLVIDGAGDVGIGAGTNPDASLHVERSDGTAKVFVEETNGTASARTLFELSNNGEPRFNLRNTSTSSNWQLGARDDYMVISKAGSGDTEFYLRNVSGQPRLGVGVFPAHPFQVQDGAGGGGAYTDGFTWTDVSTRTKKKNIRDIRPDDAMKALDELTPVTYQYKGDETNDTRAGFIAEDVPEIVARNDRKSLSALEIVAVLTQVVKEQKVQIEKLQGDNMELKGDNMELRADSMELKERLTRLEQAL